MQHSSILPMISNTDALTVLLLLYVLSMIIVADFSIKYVENQNYRTFQSLMLIQKEMNLLNATKYYQEKEL